MGITRFVRYQGAELVLTVSSFSFLTWQTLHFLTFGFIAVQREVFFQLAPLFCHTTGLILTSYLNEILQQTLNLLAEYF